MIVYGSRTRREPTGRLLDGLRRGCRAAARAEAGIGRRAALCRVLVDAGEIAQGVADALAADQDDDSAAERLAARLTHAAARALLCDGAALAEVVALAGSLEAALARGELPETVSTPLAVEGFTCYAVYPEAYAVAAAPLRGEPVVAIGIRSIGATLAAVVAAACGAGPAYTVRPRGHPFRRELRVADGLRRALLADPRAVYAVVDEGPGLSGSSFAAVGDWLAAHGVAEGRIHYFPSHPGEPGPRASAEHRARWRGAARHPAGFDASFLGAAEELSAGRWRRRLYRDEAEWPAAETRLERRKFLLPDGGFAKFAGLGRTADGKLERARRLAAAGLGPRVRGMTHGFLVTDWVGGRPLPPGGDRDRARQSEALRRYFALLWATEPVPDDHGASAAELADMARFNAERLLGAPLTHIDRYQQPLPRPGARRRTDNRMHAHEWIVAPGGELLKTDAVDHAAGHDLIGAQDLAWDLAGARVELGLSDDELADLGLAIGEDALAFHTACYLAFQGGAAAMAAEGASDPAEEARLRRERDRYAGLLARLR